MTTNPNRITRRGFFQRTGLAAVSAAGFPGILNARSPADRLNLAFIGVGGRGGGNLKEIMSKGTENVVALCDVNAQYLDSAAVQYPKARTYKDFRRLYEDAKDIDAVVVSSTEHTHAFATLPALQMRKPVYCEKPLTQNVREARLIMEAAAKAGVPTQMGTQIHATPNYRRVVELVQSGAIGAVREAHVWVSRAWGWQSKEEADQNKDIVFVTDRPKEEMQPPAWLDWDLWIGPAPWRPYHEVYLPGPKWYRWWDFGNGTMSDLGSHWLDLPFWALKLDSPQTIEAFGPPPHPEIAPASLTAAYEYGARGDLPPCKVTWYQGTHKPEIWKRGLIPAWPNGALFIGERATLLSDYSKHVVILGEKCQEFRRPQPFIPDSPGHHQEWIQACKTGGPTGSPFSYAGLLTVANHLGNVAFRIGRKLEWDREALRAKNCPEADRFLGREPRAGWKLA
jgi:predicted dehydrogenase